MNRRGAVMSINKRSASVMAVLVTSSLCSPSSAALVPILPFQGSLTETWELFPTVLQEGYHLPSPSGIMDGGASISSPRMTVYEPGLLDFGLGSSGYAAVADGTKAMGSNGFEQSTVVVLAEPIVSFGAYWGAFTDTQFGGDPAWVSVSFFDESGGLIGTELFSYSRSLYGDGLLEWHGWSSTVPIKTITYTEDFVVIDGLQANPVPEPATLSLFVLASLLSRRCRLQQHRR